MLSIYMYLDNRNWVHGNPIKPRGNVKAMKTVEKQQILRDGFICVECGCKIYSYFH